MTALPDYGKIQFEPMAAAGLGAVVPEAAGLELELLAALLCYNTTVRTSAAAALLHPYLFTEPLPVHHSELPVPRTRHGHSVCLF